MKFKLNSSSLLALAIYIQVIYAFLPIIRVSPYIIKFCFRAIPFALLFISVAICDSIKMIKEYLLIMLFAVFIGFSRSLVYANGIVDSYLTNIMGSLLYWSCVAEGLFVLRFLNNYQAIKIIKTSIVLIMISSFTSIIGAIRTPGAIRHTTSMETTEFAYYKFNVGAYSYVFALVFMLVIFYYLIRYNDTTRIFSKRLLVVITIEVVVNIILSQFMTAIAVALVSVLAFVSSKNTKRIVVTLVIIALLFVLLRGPIAILLYKAVTFASNRGMSELAERLYGIYTILTTGSVSGGDVGARLYLYRISLNHFKNNPLLGLIGELGFTRAEHHSVSWLLNNASSFNRIMAVGQHSDIIDLLGGGGIIGFFPFILVLRSFWRKIKQFAIDNKSSLKYVMIGIIQYIVYGVFDHSFSCTDVALVLFILIPCMTKTGSGITQITDPVHY